MAYDQEKLEEQNKLNKNLLALNYGKTLTEIHASENISRIDFMGSHEAILQDFLMDKQEVMQDEDLKDN